LPKKVLPKEKYVTETLFTENQPNQWKSNIIIVFFLDLFYKKSVLWPFV
jgi:hypothetical protein